MAKLLLSPCVASSAGASRRCARRAAGCIQPVSKGRRWGRGGGGIGSLAADALMIRDGGMLGSNITVIESMPDLGGSLDGGGSANTGYTMRGGRMLTTDNYECTWELFKSIPSIEHPGKSVYDETVEFNEFMKSCAKERLIDRNRAILNVKSMGYAPRSTASRGKQESDFAIDVSKRFPN